MASYYIYYKVSPSQASTIREAVDELQRSMAARTGIAGRLMCRRDRPDTWMEVYEDVRDEAGFDAALADEVKRSRFAELLGAGATRITEIFRPL
jgi:hypothetical protein